MIRSLTFRLQPRDDLKDTLDRRVVGQASPAAFVLAAVGSLTVAQLRFAGASEPTALTDGPYEILSLSGTLGASSGSHLHIAIADSVGRVSGGHVCPGCLIHTTAEVVLGFSAHERYQRVLDPATGCRELQVGPASE